MSKGSTRRPCLVPDEEMTKRWAVTFGRSCHGCSHGWPLRPVHDLGPLVHWGGNDSDAVECTRLRTTLRPDGTWEQRPV